MVLYPELFPHFFDSQQTDPHLLMALLAPWLGTIDPTAMSIEGPSLVRLLDSLERRGFIERREDESDRRARGIHLTRAGRDLAVRAARIGNDLQKRLLESVPSADLDICERVLETLEREIEEPQQTAPSSQVEPSKRRKR